MELKYNVEDPFSVLIKYKGKIAVEDYMFMGTANQDGIEVYLYKNIDTRDYINIDKSGNYYNYINGLYQKNKEL